VQYVFRCRGFVPCFGLLFQCASLCFSRLSGVGVCSLIWNVVPVFTGGIVLTMLVLHICVCVCVYDGVFLTGAPYPMMIEKNIPYKRL
jgi:hypothetical protein